MKRLIPEIFQGKNENDVYIVPKHIVPSIPWQLRSWIETNLPEIVGGYYIPDNHRQGE